MKLIQTYSNIYLKLFFDKTREGHKSPIFLSKRFIAFYFVSK
jgi:hypothetical protein